MNTPKAESTPASGRDDLIPTRWSLIGRLKNWDDQESWRDFFETYWRLIYGVAFKAGLTHTEAEDVVQETVVSVCKSMADFKADPAHGSFKSWLLKLTRWRITDQIRKRELHTDGQSAMDEALEKGVEEAVGSVLETIWDEEWQNHLIEAALEKLKRQVSARQFQIFYLHVIKQMTASETANALRIHLPQVYLTKHRVKPLFEKALEEVAKPA